MLLVQRGGHLNYEELQIDHSHIPIIEMDLTDVDGLKGLYYDGMIAIEQKLSGTEKACILAEELGHYYTTYGDILDQSDTGNRKQELRARKWAYDRQVGLIGIIRCYEHGCQSIAEMADYLEVTEEFLHEALSHYKRKYGLSTNIDRYIIYFEPTLLIGKID